MKFLFKKIKIIIILILFSSFLCVFGASKNFELELKIEDDFLEGERFNCELNYKSSKKNYKFYEGIGKQKLTITQEIGDDFEFECERELSKVEVKIYREDSKIYNEIYRDISKISYVVPIYDIFLSFESTNFGTNQETSCSFKVDNEEINFVLNPTNIRTYSVDTFFVEDVDLNCDERLDKISVEIDKDLIDIYDHQFLEKRGFDLNLENINKSYTFSLQIFNEFDENEVECSLSFDRDEEDFEFDWSKKLSDFLIERDFNLEVLFNCEKVLDEIKFFVYEKSDRDRTPIFSKKYSNVSEISYFGERNSQVNEEEIKLEINESFENETKNSTTEKKQEIGEVEEEKINVGSFENETKKNFEEEENKILEIILDYYWLILICLFVFFLLIFVFVKILKSSK